jgi:hypothetical protein
MEKIKKNKEKKKTCWTAAPFLSQQNERFFFSPWELDSRKRVVKQSNRSSLEEMTVVPFGESFVAKDMRLRATGDDEICTCQHLM